jgi:hypothetical protein
VCVCARARAHPCMCGGGGVSIVKAIVLWPDSVVTVLLIY